MELTEDNNTVTFRECEERSSLITGTSLLGYIDVSYSTLVELFGDPFTGDDVDGYKTDAEWHVEINSPDGDHVGFVSIYNYKDGKNYLGADGLNVSDMRDWHVGGRSAMDKILLEEYIRAVPAV
jgi:hypothetical protein